MRRRSGRAAVALSLVVLGACGLEEPPVELSEVESAIGGPCLEEVCGTNSPEMDLVGFHDLSLVGQPNLEGFAIEMRNGTPQLIKGANTYVLRVLGGVVSGVQFPFGGISGTQLIGAYIPIRNVKTLRRYHLVIRGVTPMGYAVPRNNPPPPSFEAYSLTYRYANLDYERSLCNNIDALRKLRNDDYEQFRLELLGLGELQSVIFEGDKIYSASKTMEKLADDRWINIGCAGHTLAKLFLTRNTVHSQLPGIPRAWEQRQATLKFLVADYCNNGYPFTVFGEKVVWQGDLMTYFSPPASLEARWDENGATCIHKPRLEAPSTALGQTLFPNVMDEIRRVCKPVPPPCFNLNPADPQGKDRISGNPPHPPPP